MSTAATTTPRVLHRAGSERQLRVDEPRVVADESGEGGSNATVRSILRKAASRAFGGGVPGACAMAVQVLVLMWLRTLVNYQYRHGTSLAESARSLYAEGGVPRFYRGLLPALIQAPLSRFGDTAANSGVIFFLSAYRFSSQWPLPAKTSMASAAAAAWRIFLTPVDTLKTTLQVEGGNALPLLSEKITRYGPLVLYDGCLGAAVASWVSHYPWFTTYNILSSKIPVPYSSGWKVSTSGQHDTALFSAVRHWSMVVTASFDLLSLL